MAIPERVAGAIETIELTRTFGDLSAVRDLTLSVPAVRGVRPLRP